LGKDTGRFRLLGGYLHVREVGRSGDGGEEGGGEEGGDEKLLPQP